MRNGDFVRTGYRSGGLLVLNVVAQINNETAVNSTYTAEFADLWHGRLGHVNFASLKRLRSMSLIPNVITENYFKCSACGEAKLAKKPFKNVTTRKTELVELAHSDIADFKKTISNGGKK